MIWLGIWSTHRLELKRTQSQRRTTWPEWIQLSRFHSISLSLYMCVYLSICANRIGRNAIEMKLTVNRLVANIFLFFFYLSILLRFDMNDFQSNRVSSINHHQKCAVIIASDKHSVQYVRAVYNKYLHSIVAPNQCYWFQMMIQ